MLGSCVWPGSGLHYANSNDRGRTFGEYAGNPVLTHPGARIDSPKPFFHKETQRWISPTFDHFVDKKGVRHESVGIYSSADLIPGDNSVTVFNACGVEVQYDAKTQLLVCQNVQLSLKPIDGQICFRTVVDRTSVEMFGNDGSVYIPICSMLPTDNRKFSWQATQGEAQLATLRVHALKSVWGNWVNR